MKELIAATAAAGMIFADQSPDRNRPLIHRRTNTAWWLVRREFDGVVARDVCGYVVKFKHGELEEPEFTPVMPPVILSCGKLVESVRHPNGMHIAIGRMTDAQWREYCQLLIQWKGHAQ